LGESPHPPLALRRITKAWPRRREPVLSQVDLTLEAGTMTWLGGHNGAGKTTLLRIACGILAPDEGVVSVGPVELEAEPREAKRRIGFLSAGNSGLYARLTGRQQLEYWARLAFVARSRRAGLVGEAIERFGLPDLADHRLDRISMGERQRVRLAMAFLHLPQVVLLDEPRNSLDEAGLDLLTEAVNAAMSRGAAVLWCSPTGERPDLALDQAYVVGAGALETV
jgi:ABC-type multidrug transport system ATPase subunit